MPRESLDARENLPKELPWRPGPSEAELVRGVQCGDLIALGEGRVVEHGLQEVVESAAQTQHGLPDVDQLAGAAANAVDPEQPPVLSAEEHLKHPAVVAQDLPAGNLSGARDAGHVGDLVRRQLG